MTTTVAGLSGTEAAARLVRYGPNAVPPPRRPSWRTRLWLQLRDPLIVVLLVAAALTVATGDHPDAVIIAIVIVANTAVGLAQEIKADNAIAALDRLTAHTARVFRDGALVSTDAATLVPGDVIVVSEGDVVPADATLVEAAALIVDESTLTGESVPVDKTPSSAAGHLSAGTVVVHGRGTAEVTRTGTASAMGAIASALTVAPTLTPLQRRLAHLGRLLAAGAALLCVVVMTIGLLRGERAELMVVTAISLVVAAVPESLPAVVTLSLALGARRMAARHAVVRRLPAVETLGSVTIVATDKTGTLTEGVMVVELAWTPAGEASLTGSGYAPSGAVLRSDDAQTASSAPDLAELLRLGVLCNDAELHAPTDEDGRWTPVGDPTEAALVCAAMKLGIDVAATRAAFPRLGEIPFDSDRRRMTTTHSTPHDDVLVVCKGAPERVLRPDVLVDADQVITAARAQAEAYAAAGYRVLAIASAHRRSGPDRDAEHDLRLAGIVALADPPRVDAAATIAACRAAGVEPVLITGDHVATACNIAARVGIDADAVHARTDPVQKLALVKGWQRDGQVVAMQGDGVNDAPSLRQADIGIAMGKRGTEIARSAADMVLTDDNLATVVAAIEEGRRVYANVRRFLLYALAGGCAEILVMLVGPAVGLALPLLPAQILWVNLLTHGLPGVAMGAEPPEPESMRRPPRPPTESVIGAGLWSRVLVLATLLTAIALGVGLWGHAHERPWQTMLFFALGVTQFGVALGVRARPGTWTNPFLLAAVAGAFLLQLSAVYVPALQDLLHTRALSAGELGTTCAFAAAGYLGARLARATAA